MMIKDKPSNSTAREVSLELEGFKLGTKYDASEHPETSD